MSALDKKISEIYTDAPLVTPTGTEVVPLYNHLDATKTYGASLDSLPVSSPVLDALATNDALALHKANSETVTGAKTFNSGAFLDKGNHLYNVKSYGALGDGLTNDVVSCQTAHDAITSSGGVLYFPPGTYIFNTKLTISKSNIEIRLAPGAVIKAGAANISLATGQPGLIHIYKTGAGSTQSNVWVHGGTIDCANLADVNAMSIWGSGTSADLANWTLSNVLIEDVIFKNKSNSTVSYGLVSMASSDVGGATRTGRIKDVTFRNCTFQDTDKLCVGYYGDYYENLVFEGCIFKDTQYHTIQQLNYLGSPTTKYVRIQGNRFINTKNDPAVGTRADFHDQSRTGGYDLFIVDNEFSNEGDDLSTQVDHAAINIHAWTRVHIDRNHFHDMWETASFGQSRAGTSWNFEGCQEVHYTNNTISNVVSVFDNDACYFMEIRGNIFKECGFNVFQGYSQKYFTMFQDNIIIDANFYVENSTVLSLAGVSLSTLSEYSKSAIEIGGSNRIIIRDNIIADTRALSNPGTITSTFSQVSGGSLGARTYYVRISYANESGETLASTEESYSISANNLINIKPGPPAGLDSTYHSISGIKYLKIYISTSAGAETLQDTITFPSYKNTYVSGWTEPATGLISGASLPVANTTHALTKYGIFSLNSANYAEGYNIYENNKFYGIATPYYKATSTNTDPSLSFNNFYNDTRMADNVNIQLESPNRFTIALSTPDKPTCTPSSSGGSLATGTYYYVVTAVDANGGETMGSIETSTAVTGPTGKVTVSWTAQSGAASYKIYRSTGTDQSHRQAIYYTSTTNSYVDTGAASSAGSPPSASTAYLTKISASSTFFGYYDQGDISGATTFNRANGETIQCVITNNVTATLTGGSSKGEKLTRIFTMGGAGSYTYTKSANEKLAGGSFTPSATVGRIDVLEQVWDGTYWCEISRSMGLA